MSVIISTRECYEIRSDTAQGERANITLHSWQGQRDAHGINYGGEIVINSTFGTWGNTWTACGVPFKQFLLQVEFDYFFHKLMGAGLDCFDYHASKQEVYRHILRERRQGSIDKEGAREAWNLVEDCSNDNGSPEHDFGSMMLDVAGNIFKLNPLHDYFADPLGWPRVTRPHAQAVGFWRDIWPEFRMALETELNHPGCQIVELWRDGAPPEHAHP